MGAHGCSSLLTYDGLFLFLLKLAPAPAATLTPLIVLTPAGHKSQGQPKNGTAQKWGKASAVRKELRRWELLAAEERLGHAEHSAVLQHWEDLSLMPEEVSNYNI